MRIVVTGREGQLARSMAERAALTGIEVILVGRPEIDLANPDSLLAPIKAARPDVIVSAAAYTAVDRAETEEEIAAAINADGAGAVARVAASLGAPLIHISTDYVFDGKKTGPYVETDEPCPVGAYGRTKLGGERQVQTNAADHVILRTSWVYSPFGGNFVKTMLRLAETRDSVSVVADQIGCPTSALDIADAVIKVAQKLVQDPDPGLRGVFHLTGGGRASWADFATAIFKEFQARGGKKVDVRPISTAEYPTPALRPANSLLSGDKLAHSYGLRLPDWKQSLSVCMDRLIQS